MDRDELQDRIRARRSGGDPYRRGGVADEGTGAYGRFEPEPEDARARRSGTQDQPRHDAFDEPAATVARDAPRVDDDRRQARPDVTRDDDDWAPRRAVVVPVAAAAPQPAEPEPAPVREPAHVDHYDDTAYDSDAYTYEYDDWDDGRERRSSGVGAFAILGFLALGVLALLGGAVLAGVFNGEPNTAGVDPSPSPSASVAPSVAPSTSASVAASVAASAAPSGEPPASDEPVVFPDGFTAEAQPCLPGSADLDGCASNGAANAGAVDMWIGFTNGQTNDVLGVTLIGPDGSPLNEGSISLADINCVAPCGGYTRFPFSGLSPGRYTVEITRNGDPAGSTTFEVS